MVSAAIVSALPCPKGCSISAGLEAILKPKTTTALLAISDRVWNASAIREMLFEIIPKKSFIVNIASLNKYIRNLSIKHIKRAILFCKETNSKLYTFHPGFVGDPSRASKNKKNYDFIWKQNGVRKSYKLAFNYMLNSLKTIVNFARKNNIIILKIPSK